MDSGSHIDDRGKKFGLSLSLSLYIRSTLTQWILLFLETWFFVKSRRRTSLVETSWYCFSLKKRKRKRKTCYRIETKRIEILVFAYKQEVRVCTRKEGRKSRSGKTSSDQSREIFDWEERKKEREREKGNDERNDAEIAISWKKRYFFRTWPILKRKRAKDSDDQPRFSLSLSIYVCVYVLCVPSLAEIGRLLIYMRTWRAKAPAGWRTRRRMTMTRLLSLLPCSPLFRLAAPLRSSYN